LQDDGKLEIACLKCDIHATFANFVLDQVALLQNVARSDIWSPMARRFSVIAQD
jgi:hypothetical protein